MEFHIFIYLSFVLHLCKVKLLANYNYRNSILLFVWATNCDPTLFRYYVSNASITSYEKKQELSEYKVVYMIKDYFLLIYPALMGSKPPTDSSFTLSSHTEKHPIAIKGVTSPVQSPITKRTKISSV